MWLKSNKHKISHIYTYYELGQEKDVHNKSHFVTAI